MIVFIYRYLLTCTKMIKVRSAVYTVSALDSCACVVGHVNATNYNY